MSSMVIKLNLQKYKLDAEAILVIDSVESTAPAKGGIRIHPNVTEEEIASLASEMTRKCTLAGLPFGGAKGGIRLSDYREVEKAMYAFGRELSKLEFLPYKWCAAPDINTDSTAVDAFVAGCASVKGWRKARIAATGKSSGIPHELGSTAYGAVLCAEKAIVHMQLPFALNSASAIVEGIGEVGGNAIKILLEKGTKILGVSDITGAIYCEDGLIGETLCTLIDQKTTIAQFADTFPGATFSPDSKWLLEQPADILLLAGPGRSIRPENVQQIKARLIVEGANIAYTDMAVREEMNRRGVISIPGIVANSGGVISSYEEWLLEQQNLMDLPIEKKWARVKSSIDEKIGKNMQELCERMLRNPDSAPYIHALELAADRQKELRDSTRSLRKQTKSINMDLEKKFAVFTT